MCPNAGAVVEDPEGRTYLYGIRLTINKTIYEPHIKNGLYDFLIF